MINLSNNYQQLLHLSSYLIIVIIIIIIISHHHHPHHTSSSSPSSSIVRGKLQFGFKLDDGAIALGAALVGLKPSSDGDSDAFDDSNVSTVSDLNKMNINSDSNNNSDHSKAVDDKDQNSCSKTVGLTIEELNLARC